MSAQNRVSRASPFKLFLMTTAMVGVAMFSTAPAVAKTNSFSQCSGIVNECHSDSVRRNVTHRTTNVPAFVKTEGKSRRKGDEARKGDDGKKGGDNHRKGGDSSRKGDDGKKGGDYHRKGGDFSRKGDEGRKKGGEVHHRKGGDSSRKGDEGREGRRSLPPQGWRLAAARATKAGRVAKFTTARVATRSRKGDEGRKGGEVHHRKGGDSSRKGDDGRKGDKIHNGRSSHEKSGDSRKRGKSSRKGDDGRKGDESRKSGGQSHKNHRRGGDQPT